MCATHPHSEPHDDQPFGLSYVIANLRQPGPLGWKLRRVWANTAIKITKRQGCCGHPGEPGC